MKENYIESDYIILKKYLFFLEKNRFIFLHSEMKDINYLSDSFFESNFIIEDLIVDIKSLSKFNAISNSIPSYIETVQLRIFYEVSIKDLESIVEFFRLNGNTTIELVINHNQKNTDDDYNILFQTYKIVSRIVIMRYPENKHLQLNQIICNKQALESEKQCGKISEKLFYPNLRTYLSSKNCNSCLNKKVSIDVSGTIKNCPSMSQSFGNIKYTSLEEALLHKDFKKHWNITKDEIKICKDCEFRNICTDCRAYVENPDDDYSKPLKCGYNPYTNEWSEWSKNPLKQKAIEYYGMPIELENKNVS